MRRLPLHPLAAALAASLLGLACASAAPPELPRAPAHTALPANAPAIALRAHGAPAAAQARDARLAIAAALREGALARWQARRNLVFADAGAVFALDDAWSLLAQAPRPRRAHLLEAMLPALAAREALEREERALVVAAANAAGVEPGDLYARRAGLDAGALRGLADGVLAATAELLGPVAGDVTLVPDVLAPPPWRARRAAAAPPDVVEPSAGWALHYGGISKPPSADDAAAWARALTVELRLAALSVKALLEPPASRAELDALASRALLDDSAVLPGAAALLDVDARGVVVERFVGLLRAPAVARAFWAGERLEAILPRLERAPPADEEGYPEAFVAVAKALPESL